MGSARATPQEMKRRVSAISDLLSAGVQPDEIARKLGLPIGKVRYAIRAYPELQAQWVRLRQIGGSYLIAKAGCATGSLRSVLCRQEKDFLLWLLDQVPPGGTMADVVTAIALDTFFEESGADQPPTEIHERNAA